MAKKEAPVIVWTSGGPAVQWLDLAVCRAPTEPMPPDLLDLITTAERDIAAKRRSR